MYICIDVYIHYPVLVSNVSVGECVNGECTSLSAQGSKWVRKFGNSQCHPQCLFFLVLRHTADVSAKM